MESEGARTRVVVLDLHHVINVDTTGLETLETLRRRLARRGCDLLLCDINDQARSLMQRAGFVADLGPENLLPDLAAALARAARLLARSPGRSE